MRTVAALVLVLLCPALARGQGQGTQPPPEEKEWIPPPLIEAPPEEPPAKTEPPPPAPAPPPATAQPQAAPAPPGPEVGLMISEGAFGALTAAGASLLSYYLFLKNLQGGGVSLGGSTQTIADVLLMVVFSGVPLAVAQTEIGIANGSHYYSSEMWPAALAGLGAQGAVLGLYFLVRGSLADRGEAVLLIGTCAAVPLVQMAVINLTKTPRWQLPGGGHRGRSVFSLSEGPRIDVGLPLPSPVILRTARGVELGVQLSVLEGRF